MAIDLPLRLKNSTIGSKLSWSTKDRLWPLAGMDTFLAGNGSPSDSRLLGVRLLRTVDRVEYDSRNGSVRTTLVKYLHSQRGTS